MMIPPTVHVFAPHVIHFLLRLAVMAVFILAAVFLFSRCRNR